jgi:hypothetical protein
MIGSVDIAAALIGIGIIAQSRERGTARSERREKICVPVTIACTTDERFTAFQ